MKSTLLFVLLLISYQIHAQDLVYRFDNSITKLPNNAFTNEARKYPKQGDFMVQTFFPMSTEQGDRAALVTIKNVSSGKRFLENSHVMALLADGQRITPFMNADKYAISANDTLTLTLEFGRHNYPIVSLYTSNN
ncbi:hypothetical protein HG263_17400 [Pseudoalteromonas sp. JBTF-M23]|uniref:Copper(I)-binding protein n=1 Tax=Pseudoalteromonas caenipelagi TaxID=2726988 RepID=A0A849VHY0_9GAMM|nr:hypothetical protein [Pseudoalteromonas caenipelagi]NOU52308.1 hypothetical protein [Pseudoalteromonas caenipelagi]